jgi:hypothetical protein
MQSQTDYPYLARWEEIRAQYQVDDEVNEEKVRAQVEEIRARKRACYAAIYEKKRRAVRERARREANKRKMLARTLLNLDTLLLEALLFTNTDWVGPPAPPSVIEEWKNF